jgi:molybdopterin converting factor small subunit
VAQLRALPGGAALPVSPLVAVNLTYARADQRVVSGDEIAIIPPVAGG